MLDVAKKYQDNEIPLDKDFVLDLLNEAHVLVVHGSGFCSTYVKDHFRAVILPTLDTLEQAFNSLELFMNKRLSRK